jgi:phenylpyruvate tautomerase PptA (4-oxalocrotonate tautomerase family)
MPFVQVHVAREVPADVRAKLGFALADIYGRCMRTDSRIVNVGFLRYPDGGLVRYDASDRTGVEMTIVTCDIRAGRTPEVQEQLGREFTAACARELGVAEARVAVYITEHDAQQIYRDGGRAPDWSPDEALRESGA